MRVIKNALVVLSTVVSVDAVHSAVKQTSAMTSTALPYEMQALMDPTVSPCNDFYQYACGGWMQKYELPTNLSTYSYAMGFLTDQATDTLINIYQQGKPLVSELFESCMNLRQLDVVGTDPVQPVREQIAAVTTKEALFQLAGALSAHGPSFLGTFLVVSDPKNSTFNILDVDLSLYTVGDPRVYNALEFTNFETVYRQYVTKIYTLNGVDASIAERNTKTVMEHQQKIATMVVKANATWISFRDAAVKYPHVVGAFAHGLGVFNHSSLKPSDLIVINPPTYFDAVEKYIQATDLSILQTLLEFQYLDYAAQYLSQDFAAARFELYVKTLLGQQTPSSRDQFCANIVQTSFPDLVGKYFVEAKFDQDSEEVAMSMIDLVEQAMQKRMEEAVWLDEPTRQAALQKLSLIIKHIGHSTTVEDFKTKLDAKDFFANMNAISDFKTWRLLGKANQPVDRDEWVMSGADVNAFYSPPLNKIAFPAAILQSPEFDETHLPPQNFGAIGFIMGHEITHGFDTRGRLYDGFGNHVLWWTNQTNNEFYKRTQCLVDQYNNAQIVSDLNSSVLIGTVNGMLTIGENIADNGGFGVALDAFHAYLTQTQTPPTHRQLRQHNSKVKSKRHPQHLRVHVHVHQQPTHQHHRMKISKQASSDQTAVAENSLEDLDRLFYVSFAQSWCSKSRDGYMKTALGNVHSPDRIRVNGVLQNDVNFGQLFSCPVGAPMNPTNKCKVW